MRKASRYPTLSSMANSGCLLLSGAGMLPHSLQCPPAFLYLPEVSSPPRSTSLPSLRSLLAARHVTPPLPLCVLWLPPSLPRPANP